MANRFFTGQPLVAGEVVLDGDEAHHLANVRRFAPGDAVVLFNGDGAEYPATVVEAAKRSIRLRVESAATVSRESLRAITIAAALPKGDRFDFLLEKLVELGASAFQPLISARSVVVPHADKVEKWRRAVVEASKQCGRNCLMDIRPPARWDDVCRSTTGDRILLHTATAESTAFDDDSPVTIAVGPEGGFADDEVHLGFECGWRVASLGARILRTETAAIAALSRAVRG
jgi:16S rRNA (uracil1498-N3)-methyltransferase